MGMRTLNRLGERIMIRETQVARHSRLRPSRSRSQRLGISVISSTNLPITAEARKCSNHSRCAGSLTEAVRWSS